MKAASRARKRRRGKRPERRARSSDPAKNSLMVIVYPSLRAACTRSGTLKPSSYCLSRIRRPHAVGVLSDVADPIYKRGLLSDFSRVRAYTPQERAGSGGRRRKKLKAEGVAAAGTSHKLGAKAGDLPANGLKFLFAGEETVSLNFFQKELVVVALSTLTLN